MTIFFTTQRGQFFTPLGGQFFTPIDSTANAIAKVLSWSEHIPNQARIIINVPFHVKK